MSTREEAAQALLDAIKARAEYVAAQSGNMDDDYLLRSAEATKALAEAWAIVNVRRTDRSVVS